MRYLSLFSSVVAIATLSGCKLSHYSKTYSFSDEPVQIVAAEFYDVAISLHDKDSALSLSVEAAHAEKAINFKTQSAIYKTLTRENKIETSKVSFKVKDDMVLVSDGGDQVGKLGKLSNDGLVLLNQGTLNVRILSIQNQPTLILEDPVVTIINNQHASVQNVDELKLSENKIIAQSKGGQTKSIDLNKALIVRPEYEHSGLLSPRACTLVRSGDFIYANLIYGKERVAIAHVLPGQKVKMLNAFQSKILALKGQSYLWVSPR